MCYLTASYYDYPLTIMISLFLNWALKYSLISSGVDCVWRTGVSITDAARWTGELALDLGRG